MPITQEQIQHAVNEANTALARGNIARADLICQSVLSQDVRPGDILQIHDRIAASIATNQIPVNPNRRRFHLIKAWGFGFTADLDHVLGHLLLAEMTGRVPVIHWGQGSLFRDANVDNAWTDFFEPISEIEIRDLVRTDHTFFPAKWSAENLMSDDKQKMTAAGSRTPGICFLNQGADVTVGDFFTSVIELLPWVRPPHPLAVTGPIKAPAIEVAYRYLIDRYIKPLPEVLAPVDSFAAEHFCGRRLLAVHVRGSDKTGETANLGQGHQKLFEMTAAELTADPGLSVFLMTEDAKIRFQFATAFGSRVICTDCQRTNTLRGVHYLGTPDRRQLGLEVLRDAYLAARCNRFYALGCTNVSNFILHLKPWPAGSARLLGPVTHYQRNLLLHR